MSRAGPGRIAMVTGASRGIGAHLTRGLLADGWDVAALSRSGELPEVDGSPSAQVTPYACDVTDVTAVEQTVRHVVTDLGGIDLLVNNAGLIEPEVPLWEADPDTWWSVLEVNVRGPFLMTRAVVPELIRAGGGRIVNLNSGSGTRDSAELTAYSASKTALARITGGVTLAGAEHGVLAFDLAPGVIETEMTHSMRMHEGRTDWTDPADVVALLLAIASGRLDQFAGRMVRAGSDDLARLLRVSAAELGDDGRRLRLVPWGDDDPLA